MRLGRQIGALVLLQLRHWARASLPNRLRRDKGRRASAGLFRLAYLALIAVWGYRIGAMVGRLEAADQRIRGTAWIVVGLLGMSVAWAALTRGPVLRGEPSPLEARFLDVLPLRDGARLAAGVLERVFVHVGGLATLVGAFPHAPVGAAAAALAMSVGGVLVGEAVMRVARAALPAMVIAKARWYLLLVPQWVSLMCIVQAPALARSSRVGVVVGGWPTLVVKAIDEGLSGVGLVIGGAVVVSAFALAAIAVAEHVGYDKIDLVPTERPRRSKADDLVPERIHEVLRRREPGGRWTNVFMTAYVLLMVAVAVAVEWSGHGHDGAERGRIMSRVACSTAAFGVFAVVLAYASRMAARDVAAKPLLAPLPIEPRSLLAGKAARLRRRALVMASPIVGLLAMPGSFERHLEIAWQIVALSIAVALAASASVSIAFLTVGAGSRRGPGGQFTLEAILVSMPLAQVVMAPYAWAAVVALALLAFVAREAKRSALGCVRWIDDDDDFDRETPIWRALLVLAAFLAVQQMTGNLVSLGGLDVGTTIAVAYAVSSLVLVVLTAHGRRAAPRMRALPERPAWIGAGLALGAASGAFALGWLWLLHRLGIELPSPSGASRIAVAVMAVGFAPVAEEIFFRGWLFSCIENEVRPERRRWLAPLVGAFAFAAVHPPLSFVPVFVLGLLASLLYARTRALGPSIAAHVVHNAMAVLLV